MFLTGKHIDRRTLLKGVGAAIALPLLDAMRPAMAAKLANQARRVAVVYVPNGIVMKDWKPAEVGSEFAFTRILKPLEPFRQDITVLSGLANNAAVKLLVAVAATVLLLHFQEILSPEHLDGMNGDRGEYLFLLLCTKLVFKRICEWNTEA